MDNRESKMDLFLKLAKPNKNGISRWIDVGEFVGEYERLDSNNGKEWSRDGSKGGKTPTKLNKTFNIEKEYDKSGKMKKIRLNGYKNKDI